MMELGTKIIWLQTSLHDGSVQVIASGTITKIGRDSYYVDNKHRPEDQIYQAFCLPDLTETRRYFNTRLAMAARHKHEETEMQAALYQLRNKLINEGKL